MPNPRNALLKPWQTLPYVFASEPNLFSIIPAFIYSKLRGSSVIRVVDDLWPEALYERGYVKSKLLKKFLDKLEGQFAIFVYNNKKKIGLIARDEHGISPLYYLKKNKRLFFFKKFSIFFWFKKNKSIHLPTI